MEEKPKTQNEAKLTPIGIKEVGAKISVLIILVGMVFLAGILFDATHDSVFPQSTTPNEHRTYNDIVGEDGVGINDLGFDMYPTAKENYEGGIEPINIESHPLALNFDAILRTSYSIAGANYAEFFNITTWSCGVGCQSSTITDVRSGNILQFGIISATGLSFSPTSRLLVINPADSAHDDLVGATSTDYYIINDSNNLLLIAKEIGGENLIDACITATTTARNYLTNEVVDFESSCKTPYGWEILQ